MLVRKSVNFNDVEVLVVGRVKAERYVVLFEFRGIEYCGNWNKAECEVLADQGETHPCA